MSPTLRGLAAVLLASCARRTDARPSAPPARAVAARDASAPGDASGGVAAIVPPSAPRELARPAPAPAPDCSGGQDAPLGASCWHPGASCDDHGAPADDFALRGTRVVGGTEHGGCNISRYALLYEPGTSPLRLRVCASAPPPVDCPATVRDTASWEIAPLLQQTGATRAVLVGARRGR